MVIETSMTKSFQRNARRPWRAVLTSSAALLAVLALAGCGRRDLHRVAGVVHYADGQPVTSGRVVLDYGPQAVHGGWGYIGADGTFTLGSFAPDDGVRAGTVRVAIVNAVAVTPGRDPSIVTTKPLVHSRFENPATSGLSFEIPRQTKWEIIVERPK
jgi:hypothetical protein